jgi:drug/metabolite transporter (DMT)-like permease
MRLLKKERKGAVYVMMSGVFYGLLGYFGMHIIHAHLSIPTMLFWQFLICSIVTFVIILLQKQTMKEMIGANFSHLFKAILWGVIFYGSSSELYFRASTYIGTGLSMVLFFTHPAFVMFYAWFFEKHKITKTYYFSIALILFGVMMLIDSEQLKFDLYGIFMALLAAIGNALYIIVSKRQIREMHPLMSSLTVSVGGCIMYFIISSFNHTFTIPNTSYLWLNLIAISIICTALPILFFLEGLKYIPAAKASILSVLEPVCVLTIGILFLGESLNYLQTVGVITILSGALIVQFDNAMME